MPKYDLISKAVRTRHYATLCLSKAISESPVDCDYRKAKEELRIAKTYIELAMVELDKIIEQQNKIES